MWWSEVAFFFFFFFLTSTDDSIIVSIQLAPLAQHACQHPSLGSAPDYHLRKESSRFLSIRRLYLFHPYWRCEQPTAPSVRRTPSFSSFSLWRKTPPTKLFAQPLSYSGSHSLFGRQIPPSPASYLKERWMAKYQTTGQHFPPATD